MFAWHVHSCCRASAEDLRQAIASGAENLDRTSGTPGLSLARHPEIMLGMLVAILCLNDIAVHSRLACERQVPLIVPVGIPSTVLPCGAALF